MKVSVVIPYYNHINYIDECITSVLNQTYSNFEVIVVNDDSPCNIDFVMQKYNDNPLVTYLKKPNGGVSSARNYGIRHASGDVILPFDCDDVMQPNWIEEGVKLMTSDKTMVTTHYPHYVEDLSYVYTVWYTSHSEYEQLLHTNTIGSSTMFFKSHWQEVGGYDEEFLFLEDWEFWIRMIKHGGKVLVMNEPMIKYRVHKSNFAAYFDSTRAYYLAKLKKKHNIGDSTT